MERKGSPTSAHWSTHVPYWRSQAYTCAPLARQWVPVGRMRAPPAPTCAPVSPTCAPRCASERSQALTCAALARHWGASGTHVRASGCQRAPMSAHWCAHVPPWRASERQRAPTGHHWRALVHSCVPVALAGAHMCPTGAPVGASGAHVGAHSASEMSAAGQRVEDRKGANFGSGSQLDHSARRGIRLRSLDHPCWRSGSQLDHSENRQIRLRSLDHPCWNIIIIEQLYSVSGIGSGSRRSRRPGIAKAARGARRRRGWGGR